MPINNDKSACLSWAKHRQILELDAVTSSNPPSKAPSLLADAQNSDTPHTFSLHKPIQPRKKRRKPLCILGAVFALILIAGLIWNLDAPDEPMDFPGPAHTSSSAQLASDTQDDIHSLPTEPLQNDLYASAQIISEPIAETHATTSAIPPVAVKSVATRPAAPITKVAPPKEIARATAGPRSSDIDVLIALMHYIESPDNDFSQSTRKALEERIRACPKANTEAGIQCRQRICSDLPDSVELCSSQ